MPAGGDHLIAAASGLEPCLGCSNCSSDHHDDLVAGATPTSAPVTTRVWFGQLGLVVDRGESTGDVRRMTWLGRRTHSHLPSIRMSVSLCSQQVSSAGASKRRGPIEYWTTTAGQGDGIGGALTKRSDDIRLSLIDIDVDDIDDACSPPWKRPGAPDSPGECPSPPWVGPAFFEDTQGNKVGLFQPTPPCRCPRAPPPIDPQRVRIELAWAMGPAEARIRVTLAPVPWFGARASGHDVDPNGSSSAPVANHRLRLARPSRLALLASMRSAVRLRVGSDGRVGWAGG